MGAAPARSAINFISALARSILIGHESKRSYIWKILANFVMKRFVGSVPDKKPPSDQRLPLSCISLRLNRAPVARSGHCNCSVRPGHENELLQGEPKAFEKPSRRGHASRNDDGSYSGGRFLCLNL